MASIEERGEAWRTVWRFDGRKQYTTWDTEADAQQALEIAEAHRHKITDDQVYNIILGIEAAEPESTCPTLRAWSATWLAAKTRITPGTRSQYQAQLDNVILPYVCDASDGSTCLGDLRLDQITPSAIGKMLNDLLADDTNEIDTNSTVTRYFSLLSGILKAAVEEGHLVRNQASQTDFERDRTEDDDTGESHQVRLTPDEFRILERNFAGTDQLLVETLAGTGMRWSEVTALAVEHLVPATATTPPKVRIWRAWKRDGKGGWYLGTTKGRRKREVAITATLAAKLARLAGDRARGAFLFTAPAGGHVHYSNFLHRRWTPALAGAMRCTEHPPPARGSQVAASGRCRDHGGINDAGKPCGARLAPGWNRCHDHCGPQPDAVSECPCAAVLRKRPSPHDLRHSHAAWLFSDPRVTPLAISRRLGHAQLSTTSEIYGDLMPEAEEAAVAALDDVGVAGVDDGGQGDAEDGAEDLSLG